MLQTFWGMPIVVYLFLGGVSGGTAAVGALDCIRFGAVRARALKFSLVLSIVALLLGAAVLFFDLGRPGQAMTPALLLHGDSWISRGVWIIVLSLLGDLFLLIVVSRRSSRALEGVFPGYRRIRDRLANATACAVLAFGCLLAAYTGFLLSSSLGVPFWNTPLLPLLFLVASLNVGVSVFRWSAARCHGGEVPLRSIGVVLLLLEAVVLCAFLAFDWLSGSWFSLASVAEVLAGRFAPVFWVGAVGIGYLAALLAKVLPQNRRRSTLEAACALIGMFCLRWCVVFCAYVIV